MYRGTNAFNQLTPAVRQIIVINVVVYLLQVILPGPLVLIFGLTPDLVFSKYWVWQLFTYAFLHGSGWHLFFNMFALWMFGPSLESHWGTRKFLQYYFLCLLGAAGTQCFIAPHSMVVGASGAIYGLLLAFGFLMPDAILYLFFVFPVPAKLAVLFIAMLTLASAIGDGGSRIAHFSHLGGMLTGFLYFQLPRWFDKVGWSRPVFNWRNPFHSKPKFHVVSDLSDEVDRILEKISSKGVDSLTEAEHRTMQKYAKEKN